MALCKERLENYIETHWQDKAAVSLYCRPLDGGDDFFYRDRVMPSASLIKVPIMACVFRQEKRDSCPLIQLIPFTAASKAVRFTACRRGRKYLFVRWCFT